MPSTLNSGKRQSTVFRAPRLPSNFPSNLPILQWTRSEVLFPIPFETFCPLFATNPVAKKVVLPNIGENSDVSLQHRSDKVESFMIQIVLGVESVPHEAFPWILLKSGVNLKLLPNIRMVKVIDNLTAHDVSKDIPEQLRDTHDFNLNVSQVEVPSTQIVVTSCGFRPKNVS